MSSEHPKHYKEDRPWGGFVEYAKNEPSTVKILTVKAGEAFSLQTHKERDEFWRILSGVGFVTAGADRTLAKSGDEFFIPRGAQHRIEATQEDMIVLEIARGNFDENDIIRFDDKYGRVAS